MLLTIRIYLTDPLANRLGIAKVNIGAISRLTDALIHLHIFMFECPGIFFWHLTLTLTIHNLRRGQSGLAVWWMR